jgi:hypothetical protein
MISPRLSSGRTGGRKHGLCLAQPRILFQLRVPLGRFLIINPSDQWGVDADRKRNVWGTHQEVLEFSSSSLQPCRGVADHFFALAY